jgi:hypothetical protein
VFLLLGLAGCAIDSVSARIEQKMPSGGDSAVVTGSADDVAVRAQAMLQGHGLTAEVKRDGSGVFLECKTPKGQHFLVRLVEQSTATGEVETQVHLLWEDSPADHDPLAVQILAKLWTLGPT